MYKTRGRPRPATSAHQSRTRLSVRSTGCRSRWCVVAPTPSTFRCGLRRTPQPALLRCRSAIRAAGTTSGQVRPCASHVRSRYAKLGRSPSVPSSISLMAQLRRRRTTTRPEWSRPQGLGLELVAQPAYRDEVPRARWVLFDSATQPLHVHVECLGVAHVVAAPQPVDQLVACQHPARVAQ